MYLLLHNKKHFGRSEISLNLYALDWSVAFLDDVLPLYDPTSPGNRTLCEPSEAICRQKKKSLKKIVIV